MSTVDFSVIPAREIAVRLAARIDTLALTLFPAGRREGQEWRVGSLAGERGSSLGICLAGKKAGIWSDFATGQKGDSLTLVREALGLDLPLAIEWSCKWLKLIVPAPRKSTPSVPAPNPDRWQRPWIAATAIAKSPADRYLARRGLRFDDSGGRVLRFANKRARRGPEGDLQHHPALVALLSDARTGVPCGIINIYLKLDGGDRLRDDKGKTITGRAKGAVVMLSAFDEPTLGLTICEGVETGIAVLMTGLAPIWACGAAGTLAGFPMLGGVEALTIAADGDAPGQRAAEACAQRWREAGSEVAIVTPPTGDWADGQKDRAK